jgi:Fe-S-cluster-containing hydrogenase component 2
VLLTRLSGPTTPPLPDFDPCSGCPAPCQTACPVSAPREGGFDLGACGRFRRESPSCAASCAARRACPVGAVHAYAPTVERHHMAAAAAWRAAPDDETAGG